MVDTTAATEPPKTLVPPAELSRVGAAVRVALVAFALFSAYDIRLFAIKTYGLVIHEFDPWFNFRATQYLADHGAYEFFRWYDYMVWYPLGRPVGSTIYPGMQFAAVWIWQGINAAGIEMSLNDVCCYIPAWFGVVASAVVGMLAWETTGSKNAAAIATMIMAIIPAHIMRSVGGGYDNESIAMTCMVTTFYFWVRSLRDDKSWYYAIATGIAYFCMVATWGGYIFVLNMIGLHAVVLYLHRGMNAKIFWAYTIFYAIGTFGAIQIPVVGLTPLKSMEQLGPCGVFFAYILLYYIELQAQKRNLDEEDKKKLMMKVFLAAGAVGLVVIALLAPTGYFGPLSSRIRGLFVAHTRTGNPLVDSVAEHQPTSPQAYYQFLNIMCYFAPVGFIMSSASKPNDARTFLISYAAVAYYFCSKMSRLVILLGPIASALGSISIAFILEWCVDQIQSLGEDDEPSAVKAAEPVTSPRSKKGKKGKSGGDRKSAAPESTVTKAFGPLIEAYHENKQGRRIAAGAILFLFATMALGFHRYCYAVGEQMSGPSIMYKARLQNGETIIVDDYREAYWWLRDNTPEDARVMAWWDYGYQITGIGNRTSIADGNTWNHEHIATLGRCLSAPEADAHKLVRHLADYILIWAGGRGDDLAKSPHMARIGNSVYLDICPDDPTCRKFGFLDQQMTPTPMMARSLLYKLHSGGLPQHQDVVVDDTKFENVFNSKYGNVRIWKVLDVDEDSKQWSADPSNRKCSEKPGEEWICPGNYPPAIQAMKEFQRKKAFRQREDFNVKTDEDSEEYVKKYMQKMGGSG
eukprot:m.581977 g.581977  ORF g.581977 m.581977 type:complete len:803 (-) comp22335_c0_seq3:178-2586(-)